MRKLPTARVPPCGVRADPSAEEKIRGPPSSGAATPNSQGPSSPGRRPECFRDAAARSSLCFAFFTRSLPLHLSPPATMFAAALVASFAASAAFAAPVPAPVELNKVNATHNATAYYYYRASDVFSPGSDSGSLHLVPPLQSTAVLAPAASTRRTRTSSSVSRSSSTPTTMPSRRTAVTTSSSRVSTRTSLPASPTPPPSTRR